jgi:hypothetical protein
MVEDRLLDQHNSSGLHVVVSGMCMFYEIGPVFFRTPRYAL